MEVMKSGQRKARKNHKCDYCYGVIHKNEAYDNTTCTCDNYVYDWKSHKRCLEIARKLRMFDECYGEGLSGDEFHEIIEDRFITWHSENNTEEYESENFVTPPFKDQLKFVCDKYLSK